MKCTLPSAARCGRGTGLPAGQDRGASARRFDRRNAAIVARKVAQLRERGVEVTTSIARIASATSGALENGLHQARASSLRFSTPTLSHSRTCFKRRSIIFRIPTSAWSRRVGPPQRTVLVIDENPVDVAGRPFLMNRLRARARAGFFNFNGTAGILAADRASKLREAGNTTPWLRTSISAYRAQIKGWRFCFAGNR